MTTTNFTTSLGIALPTTGDLSGTWGDTVNDYISKYLDSAVAGALTVSTDVTLLKTTNAALGATSSQYAILIASGHVANITVTAPAISKVYLVINKSGSFTVTIRGAGPTAGVTFEPSSVALVAWDGSDFVLIATTDLKSMSGILKAINGGTGIGSYTVGDLLYASTALTLAKLPDVATGNALISGGVGVAPSYGKIGLTTHVSGALPAANGGTGQSSYTVGDLVYASGATTIAKLPDVATGNALISGGVGVAPSYGKIGLTTHVSGTLPVANGGTGLASYTTNHIPYASGATTLTTSANLTFNGTQLAVSGIGFSRGNGNVSTNIAIGESNTLNSNSTGTNNIAIGSEAMQSSTGGNSNVAVGPSALKNATTAVSNTGIGISALRGAGTFSGTNNTAVGSEAGYGITTGGENIFIGALAGEAVSTGSQNILIGYAAVNTLQTGSNNIYIGASTSPSSASVSNEIVIGRLLTGKGAQTAYIGGTNGAYNAKNVTTWETTSDERIKKNIAPFNGGLDVLNQIEVKNFEYRTKEEITELDPSVVVERSGIQIGVIAQELQQILPECVTQNATGVLSVNTDSLVWYLINAVKQLSAEVELLKQR